MDIKNKYFFKSKKQAIIYFILFIVIIVLFIILGNQKFDKKDPDNLRFSAMFEMVKKENVYKISKARDVYDLINGNKTAIVLFGSSKNEWTGYLANILNEKAKEHNIEEIYYYDFFSDREKNNGNYELIVNELKSELYTNDQNKTEIIAPTILVLKEGKIIYFNDESALIKGGITPQKYWTEFNIGILSATLDEVFEDYKAE